MSLVGILIALLIFAVVFWAARALMSAFGIGDPIATVVYVILVILFIVFLAGLLGVGPGVRMT